VLRPGSWPRPRIFDLLQKAGRIDDAEMLRTFNCGVGMCAVVRREDAAAARDLLQARGQPAWEIGVVEAAPGLAEPEVVFP
jgi:phosphoribosylformylglycinamidine cyclo-ligase